MRVTSPIPQSPVRCIPAARATVSRPMSGRNGGPCNGQSVGEKGFHVIRATPSGKPHGTSASSSSLLQYAATYGLFTHGCVFFSPQSVSCGICNEAPWGKRKNGEVKPLRLS